MKVKIRAISEGAMMLAMMGVLLMINRQFASLFELMIFLLSIPIIIYSIKYGMKMGIVIGVSAMLIAIITSSFTSLFYVGAAIMSGLVYSYMLLHKIKSGVLILFLSLVNMLVAFISVIVLGAIFGYDIQAEIQFILQFLPSAIESNGIIYDYIVFIVFYGYMAIAFMQAFIIHMMAVVLLKRLQIKTIRMQVNMYTWTLPKSIVIIALATWIIYLVVTLFSNLDMLKTLSMLLSSLFLCIFMIDGCISLICYFQTKKINRGIIFLILISALLPIVQLFIGLIGIYDITCAWRMKMKVGVHYEVH